MPNDDILGVRCPECGSVNSTVTDSREVANARHRRRQCKRCNERFSSWEYSEDMLSTFEKKDALKVIDSMETIAMRNLALVKLLKEMFEKEKENDNG